MSDSHDPNDQAIESLRRQNEELAARLQAAETERQYYRQLFEFFPEAGLVTSPEGIIRLVNKAAAELLRLPQAGLIDCSLADFVGAENRHDFDSQLSLLQSGALDKGSVWEIAVPSSEEAAFSVAVMAAPVWAQDGRIVDLWWRLRGVSTQARANEVPWSAEIASNTAGETPEWYSEDQESDVLASMAEISAQKEKSEVILRSVADAIVMTDLERRIQYVNEAFTDLTGYAADEIRGQPLEFLLANEVPGQFWQSLSLILEEEDIWHGTLIFRRKEGRTYDASMTISAVRDASGQIVGHVSSHHDISRFSELERTRRKFMTNVSHELRTPVSNMKLYAQLLRMGRQPERTEHYLRVLEEQADRLGALTQDILEMTSLDTGLAVTTWKPISLPTILDSVVTRYRSQADASSITLEFAPLPEDLPVLEGDQYRLIQALGELVENAVVFTPSGGTVSMDLQAVEKSDGTWVSIVVRDTGPGISAEEQKYIFERFYRGSLAESGHIPGTGLGLSMAQEIARAHGGRLTVESELGQGSTFTLWLRCAS